VRSSILIDGEAPKSCRLRYRKVFKSAKVWEGVLQGLGVLLKSRVDQQRREKRSKPHITSSEELRYGTIRAGLRQAMESFLTESTKVETAYASVSSAG
jgi:hypothetical protein